MMLVVSFQTLARQSQVVTHNSHESWHISERKAARNFCFNKVEVIMVSWVISLKI